MGGKRKLTIEEVRSICLSFGWELISTEYVNTRQSLDVMCERGHLSPKSLDKIKEGRGCKFCRNEDQRVDLKTVKEKFNELGLTLLDNKYTDAHTPMKVICSKGHESTKTWHSVRKGYGCQRCGYDNMIGENNWNYNPDLTDEDRSRWNDPLYIEWRISVYRKDGFRCKSCSSNKDIHAHHLYSYHSHPELATDINNGITLCKDCHYGFHKEYGFKNNTKEQFEMFIIARETIK